MSYVVRRSRRGRSSRSRRRRRIAGIAVVLAILVVAGFAGLRVASDHVSSSDVATGDWTRGNTSAGLAGLAAQSVIPMPTASAKQPVYPYSVVPGGVQSPEELEQAAKRDKVVAVHYAGFDFKRARLIELKQSQLMYLSYRMRDKIYWTSKRIRLKAGEKVISDGKTMARTRCGNQLSQTAQPIVSPQEPPAEKFDQPFLADGGTATQAPFPGTFESALRTAPAFDGGGPGTPPLTGYLFGPGAGTGYPPLFPPPLPVGGSAGACDTIFSHPGRVERDEDSGIEDSTTKRNCPKKPGPGHHPPPPIVPEPGTILLFTSGAAGIYLRYRKAVSKN